MTAASAAAAGPLAGRRRPQGTYAGQPEVRVEVEPRWPFRLPRSGGMDGLVRVRGGVLHRLLHDASGRPAVVRVAQLSSGNVLFGARAADRVAADGAIARMRRALGVDLDLRPFHRRFARDPLIGHAVRRNPTLRPAGRPAAFEALAWAVTEQLIEYERAVEIQRRIIRRFGRRDTLAELRDLPAADILARVAPASLEALDLSGGRSVALVRVAREVARGRLLLEIDDPAQQETGWRRLRMIPGIGSWTVEMMALTGQGRLDQLPAGDLGFLRLVGRLLSDGDPWVRATEQQVREFFAPYEEWQGLAGAYAIRAAGLHKSPIARHA